MRRFRLFRRVGEQVTSLLRNVGFSSWRFWSSKSAFPQEIVDFDLARELYKNSNEDYSLGAGHCKPIIDSEVEFMGLPRAATDDVARDDFLNDCIHTYWADAMQQMFRDACRDSKTVVRMHVPNYLIDPLAAAEEIGRATMEVIPPERVKVYYNPIQGNIVDRAVISHSIPIIEDRMGVNEPWNDPTETIHEIQEVIEPDQVSYWDETAREWLDDWGHVNEWGFVPVVEVWNEWDAAAARGQSDYEAVFPFIKAFHDVMLQSLQAHAYHSIPKVKFKLNEVDTFIRNNFPDAIDPTTGEFNGEVSWRGKEILFFQGGSEGEDAEFLEARSILGDSKTLLEFLFDCICIASETPEWAFMRTTSESQAKSQDALRFVSKIKRKRKSFEEYISKICRMALVMDGQVPVRVKFAWEQVRPEDELAYGQAFQQWVMGLEVAAQRGIISDDTYRALLRFFLPMMKNPQQEARDAESNVVPVAQNGQGNAGNIPVTTSTSAGGQSE